MTGEQKDRLTEAVSWEKTCAENLQNAKDAAKEAREIHDNSVSVILAIAEEITTGQTRLPFVDDQQDELDSVTLSSRGRSVTLASKRMKEKA